MTIIRKLPIGIQSFEDLRTGNYVYVDKTQYLYRLVTMGKPYFLGRPRRFGKSLFLSTLKAYFEGKKHLFEGLAIAELEKDWTEYPVIYIDFNKAAYTSLQTLHNVLNHILHEHEKKWGIDAKESEYSLRFENLIKTAYEKTGQKVVVLVDEYDKPLLGTMDNFDVHEDSRIALRGFYGVLKSMDTYLRLVFLTGVTKFSKISIFSDLNQLNDISMDESCAGICGITERELLDYFQPEIESLAERQKMTKEQAVAKLKKHYDGYRFAPDSEDVYNPFSVLNAFSKRMFGSYWFETGTPNVLARQVKLSGMDILKLDRETAVSATKLKDYRPGETNLIPLLFQSGYLTVKSYNPLLDAYTLGFPNEEVKYGFLDHLLPAYLPKWNINDTFSVVVFMQEVLAGNVEEFMTMLQAYYASIPYDLLHKDDKNERYYQMIFYLLFTLTGQFVETEVKSSKGRADAVVKTENTIYVFEFKMDDKATAEDALAQIDDKDYPIPYLADHRRLVKIGVEFSVENGGIKRWAIA
jgi:hypothetical protein